MIDANKLLAKHRLVSDQVSISEVKVIIDQLNKTIENGIAGDVVEFGCYKGTTSLFLMRVLVEAGEVAKRKLWLYDSFAGLPAKSEADISGLGDEFKEGELAATKAEVIHNFVHANLPKPIIKKGWFSELAEADVPGRIAFAYFDGDYYESIKDSFRLCGNKLAPGATIVVDDYTNQRLPGVARAVDEWTADHRNLVQNYTVTDSLMIIHLVL